jgi:hypothetical protein
MLDNEAQVQAEHLLENGSFEVGQTEDPREAGFPRSQSFEGEHHDRLTNDFGAQLTQTALCREVFIREYAARQSSSWSLRDDD